MSKKRERDEETLTGPQMVFPPEGVKCTIKFPSGITLKLWGVYVHFFGEMAIPFNFSFENAKAHALKLSGDCGYGVSVSGERQLKISGYERDDHFLITFSDKGGMSNVERVK
jgi:hypothetical protein